MELPTKVRRFASRHHINVVHVADSVGGRYEVHDPKTGATVERTRRVHPKPADALAMCQRYLLASRHWVIYQLNSFTWKWKAHRPTIDGKPLIFGNKGEALDYAYDYGLAGQRNSFVEYREEPLPQNEPGEYRLCLRNPLRPRTHFYPAGCWVPFHVGVSGVVRGSCSCKLRAGS